jgi:hypothetical protein
VGLGKNLEGISENIRVSKKEDSAGVGNATNVLLFVECSARPSFAMLADTPCCSDFMRPSWTRLPLGCRDTFDKSWEDLFNKAAQNISIVVDDEGVKMKTSKEGKKRRKTQEETTVYGGSFMRSQSSTHACTHMPTLTRLSPHPLSPHTLSPHTL